MRTIAELNLLLHEQIQLPDGLKLETEEFREGWSFVKRSNARRLEKRVLKSGWNFIRIGDGSLRSGVGDTSQEAIASALNQALRRVSTHFNAVEVKRIELTRYPWFFLARVKVNPYRIQEEAEIAASMMEVCEAEATRTSENRAGLSSEFTGAMPMLKQMLIGGAGLESAAQ
ncbi:MAG: hypothetical protein ABR923_10860 [Terracidiphilus sp.]|jgi:hypothetical protein